MLASLSDGTFVSVRDVVQAMALPATDEVLQSLPQLPGEYTSGFPGSVNHNGSHFLLHCRLGTAACACAREARP